MKSKKCISSHPLPSDTAEVVSLWQTTFQDSDEFVDLFFRRVYRPENTLVIKSKGKIVSALQMIPYEVKVADSIIPSAYVCGVCTLTSERGKGLMKTLMREAINHMRQKGYGIATLIPAHPWLFEIYKSFEYTHPINYCLEHYYNEAGSGTPNNGDTPEKSCNNFSDYTITTYTDKYFSYFDKKQRERQCAVLHNEYDMENIICDLKNDNGNAWIALCGDTPVGIALANPVSEKDVVIKEILYDNTRIKEALIYRILNEYNTNTAKVRVPSQGQSVKASDTPSSSINRKIYPYGLACILDKRITDLKDLYMTLMLD